MHAHPIPRPTVPPARQQGVTLIIVLMMLVIIGITSAAAIRNATSGEKLTNNIRVQYLAQQYAEAALRYCEAELAKPEAVRVATLAEINILQGNHDPLAGAIKNGLLWQEAGTWTGAGGASSSKTILPEVQVKSSDSSFRPSRLPECAVEKQRMHDANLAYVITARGFSPDYQSDALSGETTGGSVVWLQSIVILN